MKTILKIYSALVFVTLFVSCDQIYFEETYYESSSLNIPAVENYDLWYVDYHRTEGFDKIPFMTRAFTLSFDRGTMYANNNISGIGVTGNGYGIAVGNYSANSNYVTTNHQVDGRYTFSVRQISQNEIKLYNSFTNTTYYLIGYRIDDFDYDKLFYENIEYLLQDYEVWRKTRTSTSGQINNFDKENFLKFTPEDNTTFYSSNNGASSNVSNLNFNFSGNYTLFNVNGYENLKVLTLDYDNGDVETFELKVISDKLVSLFHITSKTTYTFEGNYFIQYLKGKKLDKTETRQRIKIERKNIDKISY